MTHGRLLMLVLWLSFSLSGGSLKTPSTRKLDSSWKRYGNKQLGYCVNFPSRWTRGEAFDGAGMYFATGVKKFSRPQGEIDVGAVPKPDVSESNLLPVDYLQTHFENLKRFERAMRLQILDQRDTTLLGEPALFTKDRYFDPLENVIWLDEIVLAKHNDRLFRLELVCRADQIARFEPVFSHFVATFKFDCNAGH